MDMTSEQANKTVELLYELCDMIKNIEKSLTLPKPMQELGRCLKCAKHEQCPCAKHEQCPAKFDAGMPCPKLQSAPLYTPEQWVVFKAARVFEMQYAAMDEDGLAYLFVDKPSKMAVMWTTPGPALELIHFPFANAIFEPLISFSDTEPFLIPTGGASE
jgi:hypothetical protein